MCHRCQDDFENQVTKILNDRLQRAIYDLEAEHKAQLEILEDDMLYFPKDVSWTG